MAKKAKKKSGDGISIPEDIHKAYPWFSEMLESARRRKVAEEKESRRGKSPRLSLEQIVETVDRLDEIQKEKNPLEKEREELLDKLKPEWGYQDKDSWEISTDKGSSLLYPSFPYSARSKKIEQAVSYGDWMRMSSRVLDPRKALALADRKPELRKMIVKYILVSMTLTFLPPSSRRPQSGQPATTNKAAA